MIERENLPRECKLYLDRVVDINKEYISYNFDEEELIEIYEQYKEKVEPYLSVITEFKIGTQKITDKEVRAVLQVSYHYFQFMKKAFPELKEALTSNQSVMKFKSMYDVQRGIIATEYKNAKILEMQSKRYDDEYNAQGDSVEVNLPKTLEVNIVDASVDESTLPDEQEE